MNPNPNNNYMPIPVPPPTPAGCTVAKQFMSLFQQSLGGVEGRKGCRSELYYIGVIDILQPYSLKKKVETGVKGVVYKVSEISSVNPSFYAERFLAFMNTIFDDTV